MDTLLSDAYDGTATSGGGDGFWYGSSWIPHFNANLDATFHVAQRFQDIDDGLSQEFVSLARPFLEDYMEFHRDRRPRDSRVDAVSPMEDSLYRPIASDLEVRLFEILPAPPEAAIEGRLHHATLDFEYPRMGVGGPQRSTDFAMSLEDGRPICYTALSYCWGSTEQAGSAVVDGHSRPVTNNLLSALRRLRHFDCTVVVWADQLCIDQTNRQEKSSQIERMSLIYRRAWNTVIWLGDYPEHGAFQALRGLYEAVRYRPDDISDAEANELGSLLGEDRGTLCGLQGVSSSPWFQRTWIVQEAVLSSAPYVMAGTSTTDFLEFASYCAAVKDLPLSSTKLAPPGDGVVSRPTGLQVAAQLWDSRTRYAQQTSKQSLLYTLVDTRYAQATNELDKVYGVLAICEHDIFPDYNLSKVELYTRTAAGILREALVEDGWRVFRLLSCVDHSTEETGLPSWVPDFSKPRLTSPLAFSTSARNCYNAGGYAQGDRVHVNIGKHGKSLDATAILVGKVRQLADVVSDATLRIDDMEANSGLRECIRFATRTMPLQAGGDEDPFCTFAMTVVAGKNNTIDPQHDLPTEVLEIISMLCDAITGNHPTFPGQFYTDRQTEGHFTLSHLAKRTPGRTFHEVKRLYSAALLHRRLCRDDAGHLGLVPRYAEVDDQICIFPGSVVPFLLRRRSGDRYALVGECYFHHLMDGEVAKAGEQDTVCVQLV